MMNILSAEPLMVDALKPEEAQGNDQGPSTLSPEAPGS